MLEETKTENCLYRDKLSDLEVISHIVLVHRGEIREHGEEQRMGGQHKHNPHHPPAEKGKHAPDLKVVLKLLIRTRDEPDKVITKYSVL